jgi:ppGpp synthetase/RelA/SpoT-type nucleotidyltranferase
MPVDQDKIDLIQALPYDQGCSQSWTPFRRTGGLSLHRDAIVGAFPSSTLLCVAGWDDAGLTIAQVKKAGRMIRHFVRGEGGVSETRLQDSLQILLAWRASHQAPLVKANNGLRSMVRSEGCRVEVSQRLKRTPTILDKLIREPNLPLSSMQDIGGVRAVLDSIDEVRRVEARLKRRRPPVGYSDYIADPRASGYRGVHVIVMYDRRQIEVQLRTRVMHEWAITVERLSSRMGKNLKGDGDHAVQELMAAISQAMAVEEQGGVVDAQLHSEIARLRQIAQPYLEGSQ